MLAVFGGQDPVMSVRQVLSEGDIARLRRRAANRPRARSGAEASGERDPVCPGGPDCAVAERLWAEH
ncbi:hypothetical protein [Azospirillum sp. sgz302134]